MHKLTIVECVNGDVDGEVELIPEGCISQIEILGLIEAARIKARCVYISTNIVPKKEALSGTNNP